MFDTKQLGFRLRSARERRSLSQQMVAQALNLQRTAITNIEAGTRAVSTLELARLASFTAASRKCFGAGGRNAGLRRSAGRSPARAVSRSA